jgi:hypothetical protein
MPGNTVSASCPPYPAQDTGQGVCPVNQIAGAALTLRCNAEREWDRLRDQGVWEDDYFFVSQLFEENWHPRSEV